MTAIMHLVRDESSSRLRHIFQQITQYLILVKIRNQKWFFSEKREIMVHIVRFEIHIVQKSQLNTDLLQNFDRRNKYLKVKEKNCTRSFHLPSGRNKIIMKIDCLFQIDCVKTNGVCPLKIKSKQNQHLLISS